MIHFWTIQKQTKPNGTAGKWSPLNATHYIHTGIPACRSGPVLFFWITYKTYIFMQRAPDPYECLQPIFGLRALSKCGRSSTFGHAVKSTQISRLRPVCMCMRRWSRARCDVFTPPPNYPTPNGCRASAPPYTSCIVWSNPAGACICPRRMRRMRSRKVRHARTHSVGKCRSCMVSKLPIVCKARPPSGGTLTCTLSRCACLSCR